MSRTAYSAGELTNLRSRPHSFPLYLAVHKPRTIYTALVSSIPVWPTDGTGVGEIGFNTGSGTIAEVLAGMHLILGTSSGGRERDWRGLRIRKAVSGTPFKVSAYAQGQFSIAASDYLTVLEDFRLWPKRHRYAPSVSGATGAGGWVMDFEENYAAATLNNVSYGPQAVLGCAAIKYAAGSQTFNFDGTRSIAHTAATSISSYLWTFPDGTTSASSTPTWATSTAYPDGRWVSLRVTDSAGLTHTGRRLLWKFDSSNKPYTAFVTDGMDVEWGGGASCEVRVRGAALTTDFPPGAHVALFTASKYGATTVDIGGNFPNRENVVLEGWIREGTIHQEPESGDVTFTIATAHDELQRLFTFPVDLTHTAGTPADWLTMKNLTLDRAALFICRWQSTILDVVDVTFVGNTAAATNTKKYQSLPAMQNLWSLLSENYAWLPGGTVSCDSQSGIYFEQDSIVAGNTSSQTSMFTLGDADRRGLVEVEERDFNPNAQMTLYGVDSSTGSDIPIGSRAGDDPAAYAETLDEIPAGLMMTQAQANTWAGNLRAQRNNPYPKATIPLSGSWRIDPTPQSFIIWTPDSSDLKRVPYNWGTKRLIVRRTHYDFVSEETAMLATVECEPEIDGPDGVSVSFSNMSGLTYNRKRIGLGTLPSIPSSPGETITTLPAVPGDANTAIFATAAYVLRTRNYLNASPTWEIIYNAKYGIQDISIDPFDRANKAILIDTSGQQLSTEGIYRSFDLDSTLPTFIQIHNEQVAPPANPWARMVQSSLSAPGKYYFVGYGSSPSYAFGKSSDYGINITWLHDGAIIPEPAQNEAQGNNAHWGLTENDHGANYLVYAGARGGGGSTQIYISSDDLATMAWNNNIAAIGPVYIHVPYQDNAADQIMYLGISNSMKLFRSTNGGLAWTDITPAAYGGPNTDVGAWIISDWKNRQILWCIDQGGQVYKSTNAGDTWTLQATLSGGLQHIYVHPTLGYLMILRRGTIDLSLGTPAIYLSIDGGVTWNSRNGNLGSIIPGGIYHGGRRGWMV